MTHVDDHVVVLASGYAAHLACCANGDRASCDKARDRAVNGARADTACRIGGCGREVSRDYRARCTCECRSRARFARPRDCEEGAITAGHGAARSRGGSRSASKGDKHGCLLERLAERGVKRGRGSVRLNVCPCQSHDSHFGGCGSRSRSSHNCTVMLRGGERPVGDLAGGQDREFRAGSNAKSRASR